MSQKMYIAQPTLFEQPFLIHFVSFILFPESLRHVGCNCKCAWSLYVLEMTVAMMLNQDS